MPTWSACREMTATYGRSDVIQILVVLCLSGYMLLRHVNQLWKQVNSAWKHNLGDLFHHLGLHSGCSQLKCSVGNSGLLFIGSRNINSFIYSTAAHAVCKQTWRAHQNSLNPYLTKKPEKNEWPTKDWKYQTLYTKHILPWYRGLEIATHTHACHYMPSC